MQREMPGKRIAASPTAGLRYPARPCGGSFFVVALLLPAPAAAAHARAPDFVVAGYGWGHGVGMSQYGAQGFALHGWSCRQILAHYYPGTQLVREHPQDVRVLLAEGRSRVTIGSRGRFLVRDAHGKRLRL